MSWASKEFETLDLGDKRLNERTALLAERLAERPTASIPEACQGWAEAQGAYRLLSNEKVIASAIVDAHVACTTRRISARKLVLCLQDTTSLDCNGQDIEGPGPLRYEAQRGLFLHPTYAITTEREPKHSETCMLPENDFLYQQALDSLEVAGAFRDAAFDAMVSNNCRGHSCD